MRASRRRLLAAAAAAVILCPNAAAVPLSDLVNGATITVFDKIFDQFFVENSQRAGQSVDPSSIDVQPLADDPLNPGLRFTTSAVTSTTLDDDFLFALGYRVRTADGAARIKDNSLELLEFSFSGDGGLVSIGEFVEDGDLNLLGFKLVEADQLVGSFDLFDEALFAPQSLVLVSTTVVVFNDVVDEQVSLFEFTQRFSQTPVAEPASLVLLGLALAGAGIARRRTRPG